MARNRKRAKDRRARRPQPVGTARLEHEEAAPSPMEHATPDVELAEAQLALGRPDLAPSANGEPEAAAETEAEEDELELELEPEGGEDGGGGGFRAPSDQDFDDETPSGGGGSEVAAPATVTTAHRAPQHGNRLINFLLGSWHELQRVQWPDRRQVMQATGVVIGFVIVAGLFLGLADYVSQEVVKYILK